MNSRFIHQNSTDNTGHQKEVKSWLQAQHLLICVLICRAFKITPFSQISSPPPPPRPPFDHVGTQSENHWFNLQNPQA